MSLQKRNRSTTGKGQSLSRVVSSVSEKKEKTGKRLNLPAAKQAAPAAEAKAKIGRREQHEGCSSSLSSISKSVSKRVIASGRKSRQRAGNCPIYVPVRSSLGFPLMPCHPARARELVRKGKAIRRFKKGLFYIVLVKEESCHQPVATGIDPGSKKEGFTVKSEKRTFINLNSDAITHVKDAIEVKRNMRRSRRYRNTPNRKKRTNRKGRQMPPSTLARWQRKLNICKLLAFLYPITDYCVENISAKTKEGKRRWNSSFSPLEVGKKWFIEELKKLGNVTTKEGYETKEIRDKLGLKKSKNKMEETFYAHCVDSWCLAWSVVGGMPTPDNTDIYCISAIKFHRRQLHKLQPAKGGIRRREGGTRSLGLKRGSLVKHSKYGVVYVGGNMDGKINLHNLKDGKRLTQKALVKDCVFMSFNNWKIKRVGEIRSRSSTE